MIINSYGSWRRDVAILFIALSVLFCIGLGARPYLTPSEARYIELPRQMLSTGDWLTPRINGVPYFEKPPLFYWMQAAVMSLFGEGEFAGRITTALLTALTCLVTYAVGRLLYGRLSGLLAACVLSTSLMGYGLSRVATLDVPVSFFITICLGSFLAAQHCHPEAKPKNLPQRKEILRYTQDDIFYLLMYATSALAVMTKGLIGIVIPGMVIGTWIAFTRRWHILKEARLVAGLLLFLAITAPWHVLMAQKHPDFLHFYFIHEHFTRYLTDEHKRTAPWWFFIAVTLAGLLPWSFILFPSSRHRPGSTFFYKNDTLFLWLWTFLPLIFFSTSHSKLIPYIFPIFPPLSILIGHTLAEYWENKRPNKTLRINAIMVIIIFASVIIASQLLPVLPGKLGQKIAAATSGISLAMLLPMILALAWLGYVLIRKKAVPYLIASLAGFGIVAGLSANHITAALDTATIKPLALSLKEKLRPDDMVVAYGSYWQDLPVYLDRNVTVAGWTGELSFGVEHYPKTQDWMISTNEFWQRCSASSHNVYVFIHEDMAKNLPMPNSCRLQPIATYGKTVLMEKE